MDHRRDLRRFDGGAAHQRRARRHGGALVLVFAALAAPVAVACFVWARGRASMVLALASIALVALIALHAFVIVAFAYQGLTVLLLIPAILAAAFAAAATARSRGEAPRSPAG